MGAYKRDSAGINAMLASHELFGEVMSQAAEAVAEEARSTAPYDPHSTKPEHFKDSIKSEVIDDQINSRFGPHDVVAARVYSDDPAALAIETGTSRTPAHNTLDRALDVLPGASRKKSG